MLHKLLSGFCLASLAAGPLLSQQNNTFGTDFAVSSEDLPSTRGEYSPFVGQNFPNRVFWGDSHLHTSYSWDAGLVGGRLDPGDAYRFARGEEVTGSFGVRAQLVRPLDWLVVADHAESLGVAQMIERADPRLLATDVGRATYDLWKAGDAYGAFAEWGSNVIVGGDDPLNDPEIARTVWEEITAYAEQFNDPGAFTAFIGYEWTSAPGGNNLHRVIVYRNDASKADQLLPYGGTDSSDPEDLWTWMETYEAKTGGNLLAIPHNGNLSNGVMFAVETMSGEPIDADYAERRSRHEPLYEVTQMKGDGEAHPLLSPDDEFADYGTWDRGNWNGEAKSPEMLQTEYARSALKLGLQLEQKLGVNPFKFGMVGATDSHTGLSTTREDNYFGKVPFMEPSDDRFEAQIVPDPNDEGVGTYEFETLASGLQGVWARENSRTALFDAMQRKETYATTGSRITVRVFAGWDFEADEVLSANFAETGYARGVPMGGDMRAYSEGAAPRLMIRALRDPDGANLDRIQVVKGWLDAVGELQEFVIDVACSDVREIVDGRCDRPVGDTVDVPNATYTNNIGEALLMGYWEDPDFDPAERAFYYVRVLEIPTPRWTTYDAAFYGVDLPEGVPAVQQDRAYTSPIWYTPD
ncbi:DUF3604 domain-containing protein [Aliiruegeria sabulilitoris]|uniref:DUF3604 domain-containing protein n=1 Tax=Aliiruegeria sabulilitoris TaxID=1510458 RepID=UPI0009EAA1B0|nr:DUF3604 domain-containing protein [Aliiruegeria sabulilitoris]NDR57943.1 DUF3604 domain-containing protein [Pseudoruegeria sp. M32A2M]